MKEIKFCPLLTGYEKREPILRGQSTFTFPILRACIKEQCAAYDNGHCKHFGTSTEKSDENE